MHLGQIFCFLFTLVALNIEISELLTIQVHFTIGCLKMLDEWQTVETQIRCPQRIQHVYMVWCFITLFAQASLYCVDSGHMPHSVVSDLDLHCLLRPIYPNNNRVLIETASAR